MITLLADDRYDEAVVEWNASVQSGRVRSEAQANAQIALADACRRNGERQRDIDQLRQLTQEHPADVAAQTAAVRLGLYALEDAVQSTDSSARSAAYAAAQDWFFDAMKLGGAKVSWSSLSRLAWAYCFLAIRIPSEPGAASIEWLSSEDGDTLTPEETLRRTEPESRPLFRELLNTASPIAPAFDLPPQSDRAKRE